MKHSISIFIILVAMIFFTGCESISSGTVDYSHSSSTFISDSARVPSLHEDGSSSIAANSYISQPSSDFLSDSDDHGTPTFSQEDFIRVYVDGYIFFQKASIGLFSDIDYEDQFMEGENQWVALRSFSSEQDFLDYCAQYFTAAFVDANIAVWFDGGCNAYLSEHNGKLYYNVPDGGGVTGPLDIESITYEEVEHGKVVCSCHNYDPQLGKTMDSGEYITLVHENDFWKIDNIKSYDE